MAVAGENAENPTSGQRCPSRDLIEQLSDTSLQRYPFSASMPSIELSSYVTDSTSSPKFRSITYAKSYSLKSLHSMSTCCSPILFATCTSTFSKLSIHVYSSM
jgi:hypothetical protein